MRGREALAAARSLTGARSVQRPGAAATAGRPRERGQRRGARHETVRVSLTAEETRALLQRGAGGLPDADQRRAADRARAGADGAGPAQAVARSTSRATAARSSSRTSTSRARWAGSPPCSRCGCASGTDDGRRGRPCKVGQGAAPRGPGARPRLRPPALPSPPTRIVRRQLAGPPAQLSFNYLGQLDRALPDSGHWPRPPSPAARSRAIETGVATSWISMPRRSRGPPAARVDLQPGAAPSIHHRDTGVRVPRAPCAP